MIRGLLVAFSCLLMSLKAAEAPTFEVASVKPTQHGRTADGWSHSSVDIPSPGRLVAQNSSLDELIRFAYQIKDYQVSGPRWLNDDSECFDINAKASPETPKTAVRAMLQTLLAERFNLKFHWENRVLPIYEIVKAKGGPKLHPSDGGRSSTTSVGGKMTVTNLSMETFAYQLSRHLSRPVFDHTGIRGTFDFTLFYDDRDAGNGPSVFAALQQQLGLRLEPAKGDVQVLVIDHIEKTPTEN